MLKRNEIQTGDILYIGVRCLNPCNYTILSDYFTVTTVAENVRTQVRLDGHSSNLFEYYIPSDSREGFTRAITFTI